MRTLHGDREAADPAGGLAALEGGSWDLAVDTWSGAPRVVRAAVRSLADRVGHWTYVSSRSVHRLPLPPGADETAPLVAASADAGPGPYAENKRGAELAVAEVFGDRALLLRAGLILGRYENAGRLPWWLRRFARGGRVPVPGPPESGLQFIDVRDLAAWALDAASAGLGGAYNTVSRPGHGTMGGLVESCLRATGAAAEPVWVTPKDVAAAGVEPWTELPVWLPPGGLHDTLHQGDTERAHAAGLRCRPLDETVRDTWRWLAAHPSWSPKRPPGGGGAGLTPAREAALLAPG